MQTEVPQEGNEDRWEVIKLPQYADMGDGVAWVVCVMGSSW